MRRSIEWTLGVPHPAFQNLIEHDRGVISILIRMPTEGTVDGSELYVETALCSSQTLRSTCVILFDGKFRLWIGAYF